MTIGRSIRQFYSSLLLRRAARDPSTRVFAYGFVVSFGSTLLIQAFNALTNIVIARGLGVEQFGLYTSIVVNLGLLSTLLGLGLDTWLIYEGARHPDSLLQSAQQVIFVKLTGAFVMLAVIALGSVASSEHLLLLGLGALGVLLDGFLQTGVAVLRAQYRNGIAALFQLIEPLFVVAFVLLLNVGLTATLVLALQALGSAVALMFALPVTCVLQRPFAPVHMLELVRKARFFLAADMLATVYGLSTIVLIGYFAGSVATGLFKPASNIVGLTFVVPSLVYTISLPILSSPALSRQNRRNLLTCMSVLIAGYGVFFLVVLWFFGEAILRLLYGEPYAAGYAIIRIMSMIPLFKGSSFICVAIMVSHGQQHRRVALQLGAASLSVLGGLLVIPAFSIQGAAALQVVVEFVLLLLYALGARWTARRRPLAESRL